MESNKFSPERYKQFVRERKPQEQASAPAGHPIVYLHPGHLFVAPQPSIISTVLGSCVTICLWDPRLRIGGANHYMLPSKMGSEQNSLRFGDVAIPKLLESILALGSQKRNLKAKIFGGASVIKALQSVGNHLGTQNVELARRLLKGYGIPVLEEDVEGTHSRKVIFHTDTGITTLRRL